MTDSTLAAQDGIDPRAGRDAIRAVLVGDQMSDMLRSAILTRHFKPGQRLVVRELEEWSGVSRATIRESLRQLSAEGLVVVIPQRGAVVATPTREEAAEIYQIRALLEGLLGEQFVERATPEHLRRLDVAFEELKRVARGGDNLAVLSAKSALWDVLLDGAANTTVRAVLNGLQARIQVLRSTTLAQPGRLEEMLAEIQRIMDAIHAGDAAAAREACAAHVLSARAIALEVFES